MAKKITEKCQNPYVQQDLGDPKSENFGFSLSEADGSPGMSSRRGAASVSSGPSGAEIDDNQISSK